MAEDPSVAELLNYIKSLTRQTDGTFQTAWSDSFIDAYHCCEQGGYIYIDFPVPTTLTRCYITRAPRGQTMNQRTVGPNASIDLNQPGIAQNNVILVANFHTHPLSTLVSGGQQPSRSDVDNAWYRGVPGIVISREGIWSYGPERRENNTNPKGYPGPLEPVTQPKLERGPPPPWVVPNQWPEGTGLTSLEDNIPSGHESCGEGDEVIVVEWSADGVHYGDPLPESEA